MFHATGQCPPLDVSALFHRKALLNLSIASMLPLSAIKKFGIVDMTELISVSLADDDSS